MGNDMSSAQIALVSAVLLLGVIIVADFSDRKDDPSAVQHRLEYQREHLSGK
jgi:hypothetical protein